MARVGCVRPGEFRFALLQGILERRAVPPLRRGDGPSHRLAGTSGCRQVFERCTLYHSNSVPPAWETAEEAVLAAGEPPDARAASHGNGAQWLARPVARGVASPGRS